MLYLHFLLCALRQAKASISLEDRVAQILKRTGSTALPPQPIDEDERGEDDGDAVRSQ